ncbi:MAG: flippase-like domain-containing protein [Acidobacteria bacterium]|nr:flippase-like domain-containing protein [Acidobacteriota bacterium]
MSKFHVRWILKWVVMAGLLYFLLRKVRIQPLIEALHRANPSLLAIAVVVGVAMVVVRVYKWQALLHRLPETVTPHPISFRQAWVSVLGGLAFGLITPARAGELGRIAFLPPATRTLAGGLFIVDRSIDLVTILMLALAGSAGVLTLGWQIVMGTALFFLVVGVLLWPIVLPWILGWMPLPVKLCRILSELVTGLEPIRLRDLGWNLCLGCVLMVLDVISLYVLVATFEPVSFKAVAFAFPLILLTNLVPITPGGIGVRESASVFLFRQFGVSEAAAIYSALLLYILNSLLPGLWGITYVRKLGAVSSAADSTPLEKTSEATLS